MLSASYGIVPWGSRSLEKSASSTRASPTQAYHSAHYTKWPCVIQKGRDGLYIGRDASLSQIAIADNRISKRHVRILPRDGKVLAIDQNSTNGTFLGKTGGERITEHQLKRGDILVLADNAATFLYQI